jgi:predicted nucleic acid-binding protein
VPYLDTSSVVAFLTPEAASGSVATAFRAAPSGRLYLSAWTATELVSALGIKVRTGALAEAEAAKVLAAFRGRLRPACRSVPVIPDDYTSAESLLERFELGLRAGDALHLAIVRRLGEPLLTLDRRFAAAAEASGVEVVVPG